MSPDCGVGKHRACDGTDWDIERDQPADCPCRCHER